MLVFKVGLKLLFMTHQKDKITKEESTFAMLNSRFCATGISDMIYILKLAHSTLISTSLTMPQHSPLPRLLEGCVADCLQVCLCFSSRASLEQRHLPVEWQLHSLLGNTQRTHLLQLPTPLPIDGFHGAFYHGNWKALHHHAAC